MCKFFSAIVTKNEEVYYDKFNHSHEDLIDLFDLKEGKQGQNFVRIEYCPEFEKDLADLSKYQLNINEPETPTWFTETVKEHVINKLNAVLSKMILIDVKKKILSSDCYILAGNTKIEKVINCIIYSMSDNSSVTNMSGNSSVKQMNDNSTINHMNNNSSVNYMNDNSTINHMYGNSSVNYMYENSTVNYMSNNSSVIHMYNNSSVKQMFDNSKCPKK